MPLITETVLPCGPTARVRIEMQVENRGQPIDTVQVFGQPVDIPVQRVTGIIGIQFNNNVGGDNEDWIDIEHGLDIGKIIREHAAQQKEIEELKQRNQQWQNRLSALQLNELDAPLDGKREVIRA